MTGNEILQELESLGSEQTRKTYRRHGVTGPQFGVSFANLEKVARRLKTDHALALELWASGNHDARNLAAKIADSSQMDAKTAEAWAKDLNNQAQADCLASVVSGSPLARAKMEKWAGSKDEWVARAGWSILINLARTANDLPDSFFEAYLDLIARDIHQRKNYVRQAMNGALIAIGVRNPFLTKKALAVAKRIGKVNIDHGDTACKTPDAAEYIGKTLARRATKH